MQLCICTGAVVLPTGSFNGALPVVLSDVACAGNESSLLNCSRNVVSVECDSGEGAAVVCQSKSYVCTHIFVLADYAGLVIHADSYFLSGQA